MSDVSTAAYYYNLAVNVGIIPENHDVHEAANIRLQLLMMQNNIYHLYVRTDVMLSTVTI